MCMTLFSENKVRRALVGNTKFRKNKDGMIIGYKLVSHTNVSPFINGSCYIWRNGLNVSSRISPGLTRLEKESRIVDVGFHILATLKDAREMAYAISTEQWGCMYYMDLKIIRVLIDPKDVISAGVFSRNKQPRLTLVCNICTTDLKEVK